MIKNASQHRVTLAILLFILVAFSSFLPVPSSHAQTDGKCQDANLGKATGSFTVPTAGVYRIWGRMKSSSTSTSSNSFSLEIDGSKCIQNFGDANISNSTWSWVDYKDGNTSAKVNLQLGAGTHFYTAYGREPGVKLDRILFASNASCEPTGFGDNCLPTAPSTGGPDLVITSLSTSPAKPTKNSQARLTAVIKNIGSSSTPAVTHGVVFKINNTYTIWSDNHRTAIAPGQSITVTSNGGESNATGIWTPTTDGPFTVFAHVDDINRITNETNESNNTFQGTITLQSGTTPTNPPSTDIVPPVITHTFPNLGTPPSNRIVTAVPYIEFSATATDNTAVSSFINEVNGTRINLSSGTYKTPSVNNDYVFFSQASDQKGLISKLTKTLYLRNPDIDRNGRVDTKDLLNTLRNQNKTANRKMYDFNVDNKVAMSDVLFVVRSWRK